MYANFGRAKDFETLLKNGIDIKDCIVLTKYGMGGRGSKVFKDLVHILDLLVEIYF